MGKLATKEKVKWARKLDRELRKHFGISLKDLDKRIEAKIAEKMKGRDHEPRKA